MMSLHIFTIGHSNHPLGTSCGCSRSTTSRLWSMFGAIPASRRHPHFSRESLSAALEEEGIEYHWLEALGGNRKRAKDAPPSPNRGIDDEAFRNYADYMATDEFRQGVAKLMEIAGAHRTAIMCAEGDYRHCHRRLLSDHLVGQRRHRPAHIFPTAKLSHTC